MNNITLQEYPVFVAKSKELFCFYDITLFIISQQFKTYITTCVQ